MGTWQAVKTPTVNIGLGIGILLSLKLMLSLVCRVMQQLEEYEICSMIWGNLPINKQLLAVRRANLR